LLTDFLNCDLLTVAMAAGVGVYPFFFVLASTSAISSQDAPAPYQGQWVNAASAGDSVARPPIP